MLDLLEPSEDEILELLAPVLVEDVAPPEEGFLSLWTALDEQFGTEAQTVAPVVPLHHRFVRVVTTVAAAFVVVAVGLGLYTWQNASRPSQPPSKLDFATTTLRSDLQSRNSPTRIEEDVTNLAQAMAGSPTASGGTTGASGQLLASACRWLEGSMVPSASLPPACQTAGTSGSLDDSTSHVGGGNSAAGGGSGFVPDRGSLDPMHQQSSAPWTQTDPMGAQSTAPGGGGTSIQTPVPSYEHQPSFDGRGTSTPTAPSQTQFGGTGQTTGGFGSPSATTTTQDPNTFTSPNGSNTSPYSSSPRFAPTSACSVDACSNNNGFTQGSFGSPRF